MFIFNKRQQLILVVSSILLFVPLVTMQFFEEVDWSIFDFIIAGSLLISFGLIVERIIRKVKRGVNRITLVILVILIFLIIWVQLAAGIL